ncbi:membrane protein insertion efficiency factor YidD [Lacimicrobium alkaliphilum]|uniref:membrane protein insertion efficiency factor YidD n=1 Tax=Lacimicrobium alkaliphilum TaxID=1526571 RepID=UPI000BFEBCD8|nr:membrane protein insertion efficiency factor YidD [Lacimicrobium alkaliphilum]
MFVRGLKKAIRWYQSKGGSRHFFNTECNFIPSCSEYTYQAIGTCGLIKGLYLAGSRIRRCSHPDCIEKIYDPVNKEKPCHLSN